MVQPAVSFLQKTHSLNPPNSLIYGTTGLVVVVVLAVVVVVAVVVVAAAAVAAVDSAPSE